MKNLFVFFTSILTFFACNVHKPPYTETDTRINISEGNETPITIQLEKGKEFKYPSYAIWIEDLQGNLLETVFVTRSIATGKYAHAHIKDYVWSPDSGTSIRPASLPYWKHKYDAKHGTSALPDAVTGATPKGSATIQAQSSNNLNTGIRVLVEVNQAWDCNKYWTSTKYPDSFEYKTSCQPSVVYAVTIHSPKPGKVYFLNPIGHGHYAGETGELFTDIRSLTTSLSIFEHITVQITE